MNRTLLRTTLSHLAAVLGFAALVLGLAACGTPAATASTPAAPSALSGEAAEGTDAEAAASTQVLGLESADWKDAFPAQYGSFQLSLVESPSPTGFGGSVPVQKLDLNPELKAVFAGMAFSKDYKEDRGHAWAWTDLKESERITDKTPASCLVCKTPYVSELYKESGWDFAKQPVKQYFDVDHPTISCATCHDPETKKLRVIQPGFIDYMAATNIDFDSLDHNTQSTLTCAQCHVEYYFEPGTNKVIHPLLGGTSARDMYAWYQTRPSGFKADWTHAVSGAAMLKAQHPDYEDWSDGIHAKAGLSCAECHLPETAADASWGAAEPTVRNHQITSPLKNVKDSCLKCHTGRTEEWMISRVRYNQTAVANLQTQCGQDLEKSHALIGKVAASSNAKAALVAKARETIREAQWYWDYVAASNSMGAHNPVGALDNLAQALRLSARAREEALSAVATL